MEWLGERCDITHCGVQDGKVTLEEMTSFLTKKFEGIPEEKIVARLRKVVKWMSRCNVVMVIRWDAVARQDWRGRARARA